MENVQTILDFRFGRLKSAPQSDLNVPYQQRENRNIYYVTGHVQEVQ